MYRFNSTTCARTCVTNQPTIPPVGLSVLPCLVQSAAGLVRWSAPRMRKTASMHTCVLQKEGNKPGSKVNIRFFSLKQSRRERYAICSTNIVVSKAHSCPTKCWLHCQYIYIYILYINCISFSSRM